MRFLTFAWLLSLTACAFQQGAMVNHFFVQKQTEKIEHLEKRLFSLQKEEEKNQKERSRLLEEICFARVALIEKTLDEFETHPRYIADTTLLFLKEREILSDLIRQGPSLLSSKAEALLDRILRIITSLSDADESRE